ncbi:MULTISPECIES: hypothetical protein [unclassified Streptomyces]|uniref:hypothetical protein n=1 Tax=unclassified Streptomyces TaxID=2593676 RepID=UPI002E333FA7|nr:MULTISPECIES: hypothetical protein [unclassified Streptomyces]WUC65536.1 hypothetical protein OG861_15560 [Streptomyces sp. NBC_00539]
MTAPHATHAGAGLRTIRAAVFTAVCVVLSAVGHAVASCATVPWWALGLGFLALFTVTAPLAGRRRSLPGIAGGLAVGQVALHAMFGLGQHGAAAPVDAASSDSSLAALAAQLICGGNSIPPSPEDARLILETAGLDPAAMVAQEHMAHAHMAHAPQTALLSPAMLLGHLLAALAAGWLLGRGDAALFRLVELSRLSTEADPVRPLRTALALVRALVSGLPGAPERLVRFPRSTASPEVSTGRGALQHTVIRRGPPRVALTLAA